MPNGETDIVIRVRDLVVGFGNQLVLDPLSLDVRRGRDTRPGWSIGRRKISSASGNHRFDSETAGPHRSDGRRPRHRNPRGGSRPRTALGGPIPARRVVFLAYGPGKHPVSDAGKSSSAESLMDELANAKLEMVGLKSEGWKKISRPSFPAA